MRILVSGLINLETTLKIEKFPIEYYPVGYPFFGVNCGVSGVGYNTALALKTLGAQVDLLSFIGLDAAGNIIKGEFEKNGMGMNYIIDELENTPQSVIIFDGTGRRQVHVDLKNIQHVYYPADLFALAASKADALVLCNVNFSRPFLKDARKYSKIIATDVHALRSVSDEYNADFMSLCDVLFLSDENIDRDAREFISCLAEMYSNEIIVMGMGAHGSLLYVKKDRSFTHFAAAAPRGVINTVGAGDALFSAFIYYYVSTADPYESMRRAVMFAGWKVGCSGGAEGFLTSSKLEEVLNS